MIKLLFNTENEDISSDEIKELLGFTDADISFKNLLSDFITSTKEVTKIIGKEVYEYVYDKYESGVDEGVFLYDLQDFDSFLVRQTRYPIAIKAYSLFAPTNDLTHTNDGRTVRSGENTKSPWQWQIDEDNKAQQKRFYKAIDHLIELLDDSMPEVYEDLSTEEKAETVYHKWINSDSYKRIKSLLLNSVDDFNQAFVIESSLLLLMLSPGIEECERVEILSRIGAEKLASLKEAAPTDDEDIELLRLIKRACAYYSLAWAIPRLSVTIFPEGVLQYQISDRQSTVSKKPAIANEHEMARQAFAISAQNALTAIEDLLKPPVVAPDVPTPIDLPRCQTDKGFSIS